jgi:FtsP/CotA-like multicopper oxidase with cupredoxin domain
MTQRERAVWNAARNRRELVEARLGRRELMKLGLLTTTGFLVSKKGLSARSSGGDPQSPPAKPFVEPLPIPPVLEMVKSLSPPPTVSPNTAINPKTKLPFEGRTRDHQALTQFPPVELYEIHQREAQVSVHRDFPDQTLWGYNGMVPGPTLRLQYGKPVLVRNFNDLPSPSQNGGFGIPSVTTHLHNAHTPSESDGFPCDFFERGEYYDQHFPMQLAGFSSTHPPDGDIRESMSTLWYHDHRVDFTSQNVYKGLAGFAIFLNEKDTGDETTGFHLPSGDFDVPLLFADKLFDPDGLLFFDLFNFDGILGDRFLVNGKIQPFLRVAPRRYRFRCLDSGPSRFYQFHLTDRRDPSRVNTMWQISNDGNLLPKPIPVSNFRLGVAERMDLIIDFSGFEGKSIYLENRLVQKDGRGPTDKVLPAGRGNLVLRFDVVLPSTADDSQDPATITKFYDLPETTEAPLVTRTIRFERGNGMWAINQKFFDCDKVRFHVKKNSAERWILQNSSGGWQHPIHIHFEEFQILSRNGKAPPRNEISRKDVVRLGFNEEVKLFIRFRDFEGRYPAHCHNTVHEDHAMMLRFDIDEGGDRRPKP